MMGWNLLKRECLLVFRKRSDLIHPLLFYFLVALLFPLASSQNPRLLQSIAPAVIWVGALLASLLSLNHLFYDDYQDGTLEQLLISPSSPQLIVFVKLLAHCLMSVLPLVIVTPLLAMLYHMNLHPLLILLASLMLGAPIFIFLGAIIAALTVGLRNNGLLLALILLPLYVPVLIFGAGSVFSAAQGLGVAGQLALLGAFLMALLVLAPWLVVFALRIGIAY